MAYLLSSFSLIFTRLRHWVLGRYSQPKPADICLGEKRGEVSYKPAFGAEGARSPGVSQGLRRLLSNGNDGTNYTGDAGERPASAGPITGSHHLPACFMLSFFSKLRHSFTEFKHFFFNGSCSITVQDDLISKYSQKGRDQAIHSGGGVGRCFLLDSMLDFPITDMYMFNHENF